MKKLLFLCGLLAAPFLAAQTFLTEYTTNDTLYKPKGTQAICRLPGGDLLITSTVWDSVPFPNQNSRVVVIRTDSAGNFESSQLLLMTHATSRDVSANDSSVYFATIGSGSYASIIRADTALNILWMRHLSNAPAGFVTDNQLCRPLPGGGCYAAGNFSRTTGSGDNKLWLVKFTANGDTLWSHAYQWPGFDLNNGGSGMVITKEQGVVLAFDATRRDSLNHYYYGCGLMKVDSSGQLQWMHCFADSLLRWPMGLRMMRDSGFVVTGMTTVPNNSTSREFLLRTDRNGNLVWYKYTDQYAERAPLSQRQGMVLLSKGKFLLGFTHLVTTAQSSSGELIECDTLGNTFTIARIGGYQLDSICLTDVIESGGKIIAVGSRTTLVNAPNVNSPNYHPVTIAFHDIHSTFCEGSVDTILVFAAPLRTDVPPAVTQPGPVAFQLTNTALAPFPFTPSGCVYNEVPELPVISGTLLLFPNPSSGDITVSAKVKEGKVDVYDAEGRLVHCSVMLNGTSVIPASGWAPGIYFVRVFSGNGVVASGKFVRPE